MTLCVANAQISFNKVTKADDVDGVVSIQYITHQTKWTSKVSIQKYIFTMPHNQDATNLL